MFNTFELFFFKSGQIKNTYIINEITHSHFLLLCPFCSSLFSITDLLRYDLHMVIVTLFICSILWILTKEYHHLQSRYITFHHSISLPQKVPPYSSIMSHFPSPFLLAFTDLFDYTVLPFLELHINGIICVWLLLT